MGTIARLSSRPVSYSRASDGFAGSGLTVREVGPPGRKPQRDQALTDAMGYTATPHRLNKVAPSPASHQHERATVP